MATARDVRQPILARARYRDLMPAGLLADRFEIIAHAGAGGMATVYRARDRTTGATVALKLLGVVSERARFDREAETLAELDHPNIVRYVAHGELDDGTAFLAMEWLDGESLAARLKRETLSVDEALDVCARVATALGHAHARGVVHRDVKPSNVMLASSGDLDALRVVDFGIARHDVRRDLTQTGMLVGTPGYMSPEQARGSRDIDARADVFALGCLLYKSLTQQTPFSGGSVVAVLAKILLEEPTPVRRIRADVPERVERLVSALLAKDPGKRPHDGAAAAGLIARARAMSSTDDAEIFAPPIETLTAFEQRALSVLFLDVGAPPAMSDPDVTATLSPFAEPARLVAAAFGVVPEPLADGSIVIAFRGGGTERVARAASCAMAIVAAIPGCLAVLGTGRALVEEGVQASDLVDRIAALRTRATSLHTRAHGASTVIVDDASATLLEERFTITTEQSFHVLGGAREVATQVRTLLGRPSPCVGRERELGELDALFTECTDERAPRIALVRGASGLGKSRVRYELVARVRDRAQVWMGRGDPMSAGAPLDMLTQAIRRAYEIRGDDPDEVRAQKLAARVARCVPESEREHTTEFIGEMIGAALQGASARVRAARQDPALMGDQIRAAVCALLRAECAAGPLVLVLEDLHWGDIPTVKLVDTLLRDLSTSPLFVLASARPEIDELFPKLWEDHAVLVLSLRELSNKHAEELVRAVLADATDDVVRSIVSRAGGNAFYLEELIRAVHDGDASLPETVLATVSARLDRLDPDARRVLRAASVFGQAFWTGGVGALVGADASAARWIEVLVAREIVQRRPESRFEREPELVFRHSFVREAAYATLTDTDRATGHRLAGAWLASAGETNAVTLAEHFERGGDPARAVAHWARACELAMEGNDLARAIDLAHRGLRCDSRGAIAARLYVLLSEAHRWRGELTDARACAKSAVDVAAEDTGVWYEAVSQLAYASISVGDLGVIVSLGERLCEKRPRPEDFDGYVVALSRCATSLAYGGHPDRANRVHARMDEALGDALPSEGALARVRLSTALRALRLKDDAFTLACFGATLEVFERIGDRRGGMYVRVNLGVIQMELGDFENAERVFREAIDAGVATGVTSIAVGARVNLGLVRAHLGAHDEGLTLVRDAADEYACLGDHRMMGIARTYAALVSTSRGDYETAESEAREAIDALASIQTSRADALAALARALLALDRKSEALEASTAAYAVLAELGSVDDGDVRIRLAHIEALFATDKTESARALLAETADKLLARANKLNALRASFLERVPENARVMTLARAQGFL
jgi:tetratricopeptide (TPR) repeat protein